MLSISGGNPNTTAGIDHQARATKICCPQVVKTLLSDSDWNKIGTYFQSLSMILPVLSPSTLVQTPLTPHCCSRDENFNFPERRKAASRAISSARCSSPRFGGVCCRMKLRVCFAPLPRVHQSSRDISRALAIRERPAGGCDCPSDGRKMSRERRTDAQKRCVQLGLSTRARNAASATQGGYSIAGSSPPRWGEIPRLSNQGEVTPQW